MTNEISFKDDSVADAVNLIEKLNSAKEVTGANLFKSALLQYCRITKNTEDYQSVNSLYNTAKGVNIRVARKDAYYEGGKAPAPKNPCLEGDCNETKTVNKELNLPVPESIPAESNSIEVIKDLSDEEMVDKFKDVLRYRNANQILIHFRKTNPDDRALLGAVKAWAKATDEKLYFKIRSYGVSKIEKMADVVYRYLFDNDLLIKG